MVIVDNTAMRDNAANLTEADSLEELPPPPADDEFTEEEVSPPSRIESSDKVVRSDDSISSSKAKRSQSRFESESPSRTSKKRLEENQFARGKTVTSSYSTSSRSSSSTTKSVAKPTRSSNGSSSIPRMNHSTLKKKLSDNPSEGTADESVADFVQLEREIEKESRVTTASPPISKRPALKTNIPSPSAGSNRKTLESSIKSSTSYTTNKLSPAEQRRPLRKVETRTASGG